jgi:hypothetical protein
MISIRNTVLEQAGGPHNKIEIDSLKTIALINSLLISEYPQIEEKNLSSGDTLLLLLLNSSLNNCYLPPPINLSRIQL